MRIEQMIEREDFYEILRKTVCEYFKNVRCESVDFTYTKKENCDCLVINPKFSFVAKSPLKKGIREFLKNEYNIRNSFAKYVIGRAAVFSVEVNPYICGGKRAYITKNSLKRNEFISPQNRSIRFFDYDKMTVDCIVKSGFMDKYIKNQIEFRKNCSYDFVLPMLDFGENWFRERILQGHALARTTDNSLYLKGVNDTIDAVKTLIKDTYKRLGTCEYVTMLADEAKKLICLADEKKHIKYKKEIVKIIDICRENAMCLEFVPSSLNHGDLQSGNIWIEKDGNTVIYDWETVGRRSVWYDLSVFKYSLRRAGAWEKYIASDISDILEDCNCKIFSADMQKSVKSVVMLEDLIFRLTDMIDLPGQWGADIFDDYSMQLIPYVNVRA